MDFLDPNLALFVAASLALIATPGQDNIYILTRGIAQGRLAALVSAWGMCAGLLVHAGFAVIGLSAILASSALGFSVVKCTGVAYLVYLGLRMILSREGLTISEGHGARSASMRTVFLQGVASNVLNPKVALFFLAFLPQFASTDTGGSHLQFASLDLLFVVLALIVTILLALFCGTVGNWLKDRPSIAGALGKAAGGVLVALGVRLALSDAR
jgi:threonine/homoserine/homoserine lactone efflux protein